MRAVKKSIRIETTPIQLSEELGFEWFIIPTFSQFMEAFHPCNEDRQNRISIFYCPEHCLVLWCLMLRLPFMSHVLNIAPAICRFTGWNASSWTCISSNIEIGKNHENNKIAIFWASRSDAFGLCCGTLAVNLPSCPMSPACSIYISSPLSVALLCIHLHLWVARWTKTVHSFSSSPVQCFYSCNDPCKPLAVLSIAKQPRSHRGETALLASLPHLPAISQSPHASARPQEIRGGGFRWRRLLFFPIFTTGSRPTTCGTYCQFGWYCQATTTYYYQTTTGTVHPDPLWVVPQVVSATNTYI